MKTFAYTFWQMKRFFSHKILKCYIYRERKIEKRDNKMKGLTG